MNADGSGQTQVTSGLFAFSPSWSPDGKVLFSYAHGSNTTGNHIATVNADGTDLRDIPATFPSDTLPLRPVWSPDGQEIAYEASVFRCDEFGCDEFTYIAAVRPDGSGNRSLGQYGFEPDWSPDSSQIIFRDADTGKMVAIDRSGNVVRRYDQFDGAGVWSPDGQQIAFADEFFLYRVFQSGILRMNTDGSGLTRITDSSDVRPDWQPIPGPKRGDYKNAAQFCKADRAFLGQSAFRQKYGSGSNAYGKCISGK